MKRAGREIRNLILLLSSASGMAFLGVIFFVYVLGSSGHYAVRALLMTPESLAQRAPHPNHFVLSKMEFIRKDNLGNGWHRCAVNLHAYNAFYQLVSSEKSISDVAEEIVASFTLCSPASLTIFLKPTSQETVLQEAKIYQKIQFVDGNEFFRVQIHPSQATEVPMEEWAYFRCPGIYDKALKFFIDI